MGFDGNGNFLRVHNWQSDAEAGIKIRADRHDAEDDNIAEGLSNTLTRDGQSPPTANIPMNGFKIVTLGPPASGTDAATKAYVDSIKKFTSDIEVTDEVIFKDGTTTRGYIKGTIGSGVAASMIFETDNDAGTIVNRMTLDNVGLNLRAGGYRLTPGDILRGSLMAETSATVGTNIRAYDNTGVEKNLVAVGSNYIMLRPMDPAVTSSTFRFVTSDNVIRAVLTSDGSQADGKLSFDIRNTAGTVRNAAALDINGFSLTTGKFTAPAWEFLDNKATIDGNVYVGTTSNFIQFTGTTADVQSPILRIRDNRTTTTSAGNAVLSIKRQNSSTDAMIFGNDANHAGLIGGNNTPLRFGKWVAGVFTEYMNITTGAYINASANLVVDSPNGAGGINILPTDGSSGRLFWNSNTHTWATCVDETEGTLKFLSGGVFASNTGTIRFRMYENGDFLAGGKGSMTELQVDPTSAVTGIRLLQSDANSGRLFLEGTTKIWSVASWEDGALSFASGGTYGSSTGTNRARLYDTGVLNIQSQMQASSFVGQASDRSTPRLGLAGRVGTGAALAWMNAYDEAGAEQIRFEITNNVGNLRPLVATTSAAFRIADEANARRIELSYGTTNPLALVARNAAGAIHSSIVSSASTGAPFWGYSSGLQSEMITVATLNLTTYTGSSSSNTDFPIGEEIMMYTNGVAVSRGASATPTLSNNDTIYYRLSGQPNAGTALAGTWRARGHINTDWVAMRRTA
jgi:hypothetical protein